MTYICKDDLEIEKSLKVLEQLSFLEEGAKDKVQVTSILIDYVEETIEEDSKNKVINKVCEFYNQFLKMLFEVNGSVGYKVEVKTILPLKPEKIEKSTEATTPSRKPRNKMSRFVNTLRDNIKSVI